MKRTTIYLEDELWNRFRSKYVKLGKSASSVLAEFIREDLGRELIEVRIESEANESDLRERVKKELDPIEADYDATIPKSVELPKDLEELKARFDSGGKLTTGEKIRLAKAGIRQDSKKEVKVSKKKAAKLAKLDEFMNPQPKGKKG